MAKDDAPAPETSQIPRKRRALEGVPDLWLAQWLARTLKPGERRRLEAEKERRKALRKRESFAVTTVQGVEGWTPRQADGILSAAEGASSLMRTVATDTEMVRRCIIGADLVIAGPREMSVPKNVPTWERSPVWAAIAYAKHRRVAVKIIMPDGREAT